MKTLTHIVLIALFAAGLAAGVQAAEAPIVRETFTCNFQDGKDMEDLMAARDFYLKQAEKGGLDTPDAFVWTPVKVDVDFDFLWGQNHADMATFARRADADTGSAEAAAVAERFATVATCKSSLAMRQQFIQSEGEFEGNPAVIGISACTYQKGHGPEDLPDLLGHIAGVVDSIGRKDGFMAFAAEPMIGRARNAADVYLYGVQGSFSDWASGNAALQSAEGIESLQRHLDVILDCNQALFLGQQVVPVPE